MDLKPLLAVVAAILTIGVTAWYIYRALTQPDKVPHVVTWGVLTLITGMAFVAQVAAGAGLGSVVLLLASLGNFVNFCIGWHKHGGRDVNWLSTACAGISVLAIVLWQISGEPLIATIFLTVASLLAFTPTVVRTWRKPYLEVQGTYWVNTIRYLLATLSVAHYTWATMLFTGTWVIVNGVFSIYHYYCLRRFRVQLELQANAKN